MQFKVYKLISEATEIASEEMEDSNENKKSKSTVTKVSMHVAVCPTPFVSSCSAKIRVQIFFCLQWRSGTLTGNPQDHAHWVKRVSTCTARVPTLLSGCI